jgi:hypothetical protein
MTQFLRRFTGALALDAGAYEDIEADRHAAMQSITVVAAVCIAAGIGGMGLGVIGPLSFILGVVIALGGWLVWSATIVALGTGPLAEPDTQSDNSELLRVLGFAAAPGIFLAFAAMRPAAPVVFVIVTVWMLAAAVRGVRQALDYHTTWRALAVCAIALIVALGIVGAVATIFTVNVTSS